jgi:PAS domain S-box-containing protein
MWASLAVIATPMATPPAASPVTLEMANELRILILEDEAAAADLLEWELRRSKIAFTARRVATREDYVRGLEEFAPDIILSDYSLPNFDGMEALSLARARVPYVPVVIVTGSINEETAVECMKAGAADYLLKEHLGRIAPAIHGALEKKQAEARLWQSEELFRLITDNVTDLIAILDLAGKRLYNSASYKQILGDPQFLRGRSSFDEIHPDDVARIKQAFQDTVRTGIGQRGEFRFLLNDGSVRFIESQGSVIKDDKGKVEKVLVVSRDVTERKRADEELRRSEKRFRALIENSSDAIALLNPAGLVLYAGPSTERILGHANDEFVGRRIFELIHPEDRERTISLINGLAQNPGHAVRIECRIRHKDVSWRWIEGTGKNLLNEPSVEAIILNYRDITERKLAEGEIQKLAAFPLYNPNPVLELSSHGALTYFNDAAQQMARALGKSSPREILPPDLPDIIRNCLETGRNRANVEVHRDGRTLSWSFFPILVSQVVQCYAFDVTDRLNLEAQLRQSQKMETVGQLAAGIAHDFNNILTVIQGHAELLMLEPNLALQMAEALKHISSAASRAAYLTRQLLTFSRRQVMQPRILDLNEVVGSVTKTLNRVLGDQVSLQCNYSTHLPPVLADASMLEQLITNLASNARDAMPNGGQLIVSTFSTEIDEDYAHDHPEARAGQFVCLGVSDTGTGMDKATLNHIFEPFFTTKEVGKGTGLGLATVYGIVKLHNGWIEVESRIGMGSTFTVFLAAARAGFGDTTTLTERASVRGGNEVILVVEDEIALRGLMRSVLLHYGYRVLDAASGGEALTVWERNSGKIDLLLTDIVLPDRVDGQELASEMRKQKPRLKIVYTSEFGLELAGREADLKEGVNLLQKPFQPLALARTVRCCLDDAGPT